MTPTLRLDGSPSPLVAGSHIDDGLPPPTPYSEAAAEQMSAATLGPITPLAAIAADPDETGGAPAWMVATAKLIRPLSVGALMAIPTIGAAAVGFVALFSRDRAMAMVEASGAFLNAIPTDIVLLIGTIATGYGVARSLDKRVQVSK